MKTRLIRLLLLWSIVLPTLTCTIPSMKAQSIHVRPSVEYGVQEQDVYMENQGLVLQTYSRPNVPHTDPTEVAAAMHSGAYTHKVTYVIAHRGYHSSPGCPEVSVCAIRDAYDAGSDGIELDTKLTFDQQIVMGHDFSTGRELNSWNNKPTGNWGPFTYYPSLDPYYYLASKPPKYLDVNQNLAEMVPPLPEIP